MKVLSKDIYANSGFVYKFTKGVESDPFHIYIDKPAMHKALGRVRGKKVLCVGSGNGDECAYIKSVGAVSVTGIDLSKEMVKQARSRHPGINFYVMSADNMKFPPKSFDILYSDLVLHYIDDLGKVFRDAFRVLKPGGRFIFSTTHPIYDMLERRHSNRGKHAEGLFGYIRDDKRYRIIGDYFTRRVIGGKWFNKYDVRFYYKPISGIIMPALRAGFLLNDIIEPKALASLKKVNPGRYKKLSRVPQALILNLQRP